MAELIEWDSSATAHIRTRSDCYTGAVNIECTWTVEVVNDPDRLVDEPDPRSAHANTVVALRDRNGPLRQYREDGTDEGDH